MTQDSKGTFLQLPSVFIETCDLPEMAQITYIRLLHKYGYKGYFIGSLGNLAKTLRTAKTTLSRMLPILSKAMLINIDTAPDENGIENMRVILEKEKLWTANELYHKQGTIPAWTPSPEKETQQFQNETDEDKNKAEPFQIETQPFQIETQPFQIETQPFQIETETSVKTPPYITSNITNQITDRLSNISAANAAEPTPLFPGSNQPNKTPRSTRKSKLASLETFNFDQNATIETIMELGNIWRGNSLPVVKRADSDYQKAMSAAGTLCQRPRANGQKGYSLREIDLACRYLKRIAPESKPWLIADEWWIGKSTDLWVIAKNIDKALAEIAKLEKEHAPITERSAPAPAPEDLNKMVVWTRYNHIGAPIQHWYLYEIMPLAEAQKHGWKDIIPPVDTRNIKTFLKAWQEGRRVLTPEQQAELDQMRAA